MGKIEREQLGPVINTELDSANTQLSEKAQQISNLNTNKAQYDLINGSLQIAQRYNASDSTTFTNPSNKYVMDRFRCNGTGTVVPISGGGCTITGTINFKYIIEKNDFTLFPSQFAISYGLNGINNEVQVIKANCPIDTNGNATIFNLDITNATLNYVHYGKAPFVPKLYGEELTLCQRYYETCCMSGMAATASTIACNCPFKVNKRITPTVITLTSMLLARGIGSINGINLMFACTNAVVVEIDVSASNLVANRFYEVDNFVIFDAEIY